MNWMKLILSLIMLSATLISHSQPHLHEVDENVDASGLEGKYQVHSYESHQQTKSFLPSRALRNQLFRKANLESDFERFDELERDLIFKKIQTRDVSSVLEDYPSLSSKKGQLKKLKKLIQKMVKK